MLSATESCITKISKKEPIPKSGEGARKGGRVFISALRGGVVCAFRLFLLSAKNMTQWGQPQSHFG